VDGLLLDRVPDDYEACRLRTNLEAIWGAPVIGLLEELPALRALVANLPLGANPSHELCCALGDRLARRLRLSRLIGLAQQNPFPTTSNRLFRRSDRSTTPTVAVAYDEAFDCYFPDALDLLEMRGARIRVFSPLRSEQLPPGADLVYLGCGHLERHAEALGGNHCMKQALRYYAAAGGRIYAEGGGLAYLCRHLALDRGRQALMAGVLPAVARLADRPGPIRPVEVSLAGNTWLGAARSRLRGYLNPRWDIEPVGTLTSYAQEPSRRGDLVGSGNVFGSRVHLNFAAQPQFLESFFQPPSFASGLSIR
jgi:cobyrinic acid a,c-diamide synthase